jgi:hypothetical protein
MHMPRGRTRVEHPKPLPDIANDGYQNKITPDVVPWPDDIIHRRSPEEQAKVAEGVTTDPRRFNFTHVIFDRIKPRLFSTLGHKILIECPNCGALTGDERAYLQHKKYHEMVEEFIQWVHIQVGVEF